MKGLLLLFMCSFSFIFFSLSDPAKEPEYVKYANNISGAGKIVVDCVKVFLSRVNADKKIV